MHSRIIYVIMRSFIIINYICNYAINYAISEYLDLNAVLPHPHASGEQFFQS
nr:hypothetical protein Q903MT_gene217 [Picea sitchensis]